MQIAITGASGFIGRHLVRALETRGHAIQLLLRSDFVEFEPHRNVNKVYFDLKEVPDDIFEQLGRPSVLIHLAWGGLPAYHSTSHFEHELPMHFSFLKKMIGAGLKRLLVTGTCFEYGAVSGCVKETHPTNPTIQYGLAKDVLRRQLEFLKLTHDYELTWMRLFYLHGEGQSPGSLLPLLEAAIKRGEKKFPMTSGDQLRDYLSVTEAAEIIAQLAALEGGGGTVNVCSGVPISVRRLVENRISVLKSCIELDLNAIPPSEYEPPAFWGDRTHLNNMLTRTRRRID